MIALDTIAALVVPFSVAASLPTNQVAAIGQAARAGLGVYTEGDSALARTLGVPLLGSTITLGGLRNRAHPEVVIQWAAPQMMTAIDANGLHVFDEAPDSGNAVVVGGALGGGRWVYAGVPLDDPGGFGYARMPYAHEAIDAGLGLAPSLVRRELAVYLDWAYVASQDPVALAVSLRARGIREVHLSAWYALDQIRNFYSQLIDACHGNGIVVVAWLELPMITRDFWDAHPTWREQTAAGTDAQIDWRSLMALEMPECMAAVLAQLDVLLTALPWDGVDLAELYFETPAGYDDPSKVTPMSATVRAAFMAQSGVDPINLFDPLSPHYRVTDPTTFMSYLKYRSDLCLSLNRQVVEHLGALGAGLKRPLPVTLTLIDTLIDKTVGEKIGIEVNGFLAMQRDLGFDLQIEDPYTLWKLGPDRYGVIGQAYRGQVASGSRLSVDINVVDRSGAGTVVPTAKQTGIELLDLVYEAASALDTVCVYSSETPYQFDFQYVPAALAGRARVTWSHGAAQVQADHAVTFLAATKGITFTVDGQAWPCVGGDGVWLPAGTHSVRARDLVDNTGLRVTDASTDLTSCAYVDGKVVIGYTSRRAVLATTNGPIGDPIVDGMPQPKELVAGGAAPFTIWLPAGTHTIVLSAPK
jgi:hypothetical protein